MRREYMQNSLDLYLKQYESDLGLKTILWLQVSILVYLLLCIKELDPMCCLYHQIDSERSDTTLLKLKEARWTWRNEENI